MAGGGQDFGGPPTEAGGPQQQGEPDITLAATVSGEGVSPGALQAAVTPPAFTFVSLQR